MIKKKISKEVTEYVPEEVPESVQEIFADEIVTPCNAWAFLLGPAFNAFCPLPQGHEGEHSVVITIFAEPKAHFNITWALDS